MYTKANFCCGGGRRCRCGDATLIGEGGSIVRSADRCGILLVNTGTPSAPRPRAVRRYLGRFLMDKRIAPMNRVAWWFILHLLILPKRGRASAKKYESIWTEEGSPLAVAHAKLVRGLSAELEARGIDASVRCSMSYGHPSAREALRALREEGCTRLVVMPLYPQAAYSTTEAAVDGVMRALKRLRWDVPCDIVRNYCDERLYARAVAASIRHAGFEADSTDRLLFSFHSIPLADIEAGDSYELKTGASSLKIANELGLERNRWTIGYQCRFDKGREWLSPYTPDALARWAEAGTGRVFLVCPNFAVDCLETLYDVDRELKPHYLQKMREAGREPFDGCFVYVPCLGASKAHAKVLAGVLAPYAEGAEDGR